MKKLTKITEKIVRPFYRELTFFPFSLRFVKFPIYKQIQILFNKKFSRDYNKKQKARIEIDKNNKFKIFCIGAKGSLEMEMIIGRIYEPEITRFVIENIKNSDKFIDVGANIGYYSILASRNIKNTSEIYSFEPVIETFNRLKENVKLNQIKNITLYNFALGDINKTDNIYLREELGHNSILHKEKIKDVKKQKIFIRRFDDIKKIRNNQIFLKIDVEGYELKVLSGMKKLLNDNQCTIIFEFSKPENCYELNIKIAKLKKLFKGYSLFDFKNKKINQKIDEYLKKSKLNQINLILKNY
jgi:FkbM family methyltransferase